MKFQSRESILTGKVLIRPSVVLHMLYVLAAARTSRFSLRGTLWDWVVASRQSTRLRPVRCRSRTMGKSEAACGDNQDHESYDGDRDEVGYLVNTTKG